MAHGGYLRRCAPLDAEWQNLQIVLAANGGSGFELLGRYPAEHGWKYSRDDGIELKLLRDCANFLQAWQPNSARRIAHP